MASAEHLSDMLKGDARRKEFEEKFTQIRKAHYAAHDKAADLGDEGAWVEVYDSQAGQFYYWNCLTSAVQWDKPEHYIMAVDDSFLRIVVRLQANFRAHAGRRKSRATRAQKKMDELKSMQAQEEEVKEWISTVDPASGNTYWYTLTGEVTWNDPMSSSPPELAGPEMASPDRQRNSCSLQKHDWTICSRRGRGGNGV